jgi:signal transduction histidine kinase
VTDTGPGIPEKDRERVFERFVQLNKGERVRGSKGSGLGLTFCKLAIEAHGGRIWVDSGPEGGAAFHFTLPTDLRPSPN